MSDGSPYERGGLATKADDVARCENGAPIPFRVHSPVPSGVYPVVVFQHGFLARNTCYDDILDHVASHGFVVVAPQMYEPGVGALFGNPTAAEEAREVERLLVWLSANVAGLTDGSARFDLLGLAGHSRGGKVVWLVLEAHPTAARAAAGVDPVDGTGGPLGRQPRVVQGPFAFAGPSLTIGTGLGGECAPSGDNHDRFYEASRSPAWHTVAVSQGHGDMLDDDCSGPAATVCESGGDRPGMRRLTAGLLAAFFRASLQGDDAAYAWLTDSSAAPIPVDVDVR